MSREKIPQVLVVTAAKRDLPLAVETGNMLESFGVDAAFFEAGKKADFATALADGVRVVIVIEEGSNGLAAKVAAKTVVPVLLVPTGSNARSALASLQAATISSKPGEEAACLALGAAGSRNAALVAVSILALGNPPLARKLAAFRKRQTQQVLEMSLP